MTPTIAEWVASECERLEAEWRAGDYRAAAEALDVCTLNRQPLPGWLPPVIRQAMAFAAHRVNAEGKITTKTGSYATRWNRLDVRRKRHETAARALRMLASGELAARLGKDRASKGDAYKWAAEQLRGTPFYGDESRIRRVYGEVERAKKSAAIRG